jgi:hypothetical protein
MPDATRAPATDGGSGRLHARIEHQLGCRHLLCIFNSYDAPAQGTRTVLQNSRWLNTYGLSTLWFAEADADAGSRTWFTGFDAEIQQWLRHGVRFLGIERVTFLGSSLGGYASIRHALLLGDEPGLAEVSAFAVNPQTGFGPALMDDIRAAMRRVNWRAADLGGHPILPRAQDLCAAPGSVPESDLLLLGRAVAQPGKARLRLFYDSRNPIEAGFSERLAPLPGATLHPFALGLPHGEGAKHILLSRELRAGMDDHLGLWPEGRGARPARALTQAEELALAQAALPAPRPRARSLASAWQAALDRMREPA